MDDIKVPTIKLWHVFFVYDGEPVSADRILSVAGRMMVGPKETAHQVSLGSLVPRR